MLSVSDDWSYAWNHPPPLHRYISVIYFTFIFTLIATWYLRSRYIYTWKKFRLPCRDEETSLRRNIWPETINRWNKFKLSHRRYTSHYLYQRRPRRGQLVGWLPCSAALRWKGDGIRWMAELVPFLKKESTTKPLDNFSRWSQVYEHSNNTNSCYSNEKYYIIVLYSWYSLNK